MVVATLADIVPIGAYGLGHHDDLHFASMPEKISPAASLQYISLYTDYPERAQRPVIKSLRNRDLSRKSLPFLMRTAGYSACAQYPAGADPVILPLAKKTGAQVVPTHDALLYISG